MSLPNVLTDGSSARLSADPPLPPNWKDNLETTIVSLAPYKLFPIDAGTLEFATISALLNPIKVTAVEQIVNPALWSRFVNARKEMLLGKTDDLPLLSKLLLNDDKKIQLHMHIASSFAADAQVAACPYDDNVALLFHSTRDKKNVDTILLQGLDERLGLGGTMGKGIYFASDPFKCTSYDGCGGTMFIFMVLLGDCLNVQPQEFKNFVREPEKQPTQQRNCNDFHFDSIVGQPNTATEFVIFNRYQCCPLYKVTYDRKSIGHGYAKSKNCLPPFSWKCIPTGLAMPTPSTKTDDWQFHARSIFTEMGVQESQDTDVDMVEPIEVSESPESIEQKSTLLFSLGFTNRELNVEILKKQSFDIDRSVNELLELNGGNAIDESEILINNKLATLSSMGFTNAELNAEILKKNSYDLGKSVNDLLGRFEQDAGIRTEPATMNGVENSKLENCPICSDEYEVSTSDWKVLTCDHRICYQCYKQMEFTRATMSGVAHTFIKCPFCMQTSGVEIGTCPDGTMTTTIIQTPCQGYEDYQSISIHYVINNANYKLNRIAYLPNNAEGKELLELLRIAWDRRICFTIGTSVTNGQENVLVWNIHHKTAQNGGIQSHGFPDETFIERCKSELEAFGIK